MSEINIVEAYNKFNKHLIILISGLSGCKKNKVANELIKTFNEQSKTGNEIKKLNLRDFIKKDFKKEVELPNGTKIIDFDDIDSYDWDKLNSSVNESINDGVIIVGASFPKEKILFTVDFHINIKISKQKYIEERHKFLEENKEKFKELYNLIDTSTESMIINQITFPKYLEYTKESIINKWVNGNENNEEEIINIVFNYLIEKIQQFLDNYDKKRDNNHKKNKDDVLSSSTSENSSSNSEESFKIVENVDPSSVTSISDFFTQ